MQTGFTIQRADEETDADPLVTLDLSGGAGVAFFGGILLFVGVGAALFWRWMKRGSANQSTSRAPRPTGGVARLVDSPIRVMRWWAANPQRVGWAMLPVLLHATAGAAISLLLQDPPVPHWALAVIFVPLFAIVGLLAFAVRATAVVMVDVVGAAGSGRARRLVELSALAYWTQVVWSAAVLFALVQAGPSPDLREVIETTRLLWSVWLIGMHATVLHVVSGFTTRGTWAVGIALAAVFIGFPRLLAVLPGFLF